MKKGLLIGALGMAELAGCLAGDGANNRFEAELRAYDSLKREQDKAKKFVELMEVDFQLQNRIEEWRNKDLAVVRVCQEVRRDCLDVGKLDFGKVVSVQDVEVCGSLRANRLNYRECLLRKAKDRDLDGVNKYLSESNSCNWVFVNYCIQKLGGMRGSAKINQAMKDVEEGKNYLSYTPIDVPDEVINYIDQNVCEVRSEVQKCNLNNLRLKSDSKCNSFKTACMETALRDYGVVKIYGIKGIDNRD